MSWIISRAVGATMRYRASNGHLTTERSHAERFEKPSHALPHAHEGDIIILFAEPKQHVVTHEEEQ